MIIYYENAQEKIQIPSQLEKKLQQAFNEAAKFYKLGEKTAVSLTIVTDEEIHLLNKNYRDVDRPTDVLSFALDEGEEPKEIDGPDEHLLGDVIISAETAKQQGDEYGHGLEREIIYLAVHGLLHLLGYDHMTEEDKTEMRREEEKILRVIKLSEEFIGGK